MQMVVDSLRSQGKIYKKMLEISPKELGIRNKIKIYKATDTSNKYWAIFTVSQKSRILMKDVQKFEDICRKLSIFCGLNFDYKMIFIDAPLCSKAKEEFKNHSWKIQ